MKYPMRSIFILSTLLALLLGFNLNQDQATGQNETWLYLPLVEKSQGKIYGRFTIGGVPAEGIYNIQLHLEEPGHSTQELAVTTSAADGSYAFLDAPSLNAGQSYKIVQYVYAFTPGQLGMWVSRTISGYSEGDIVDVGSADLADIELLTPASHATITLPATFQWTPRPTTPMDSYKFEIADATIGDPYYDSPLLGYTDHYTLKSLPDGFNPSHLFYWRVYVCSPDGSFGQSGSSPFLHFSTAVQSAATNQAAYNTYLPLLVRPSLNISGHVTLNGSPAGGIPLSLYYFDGYVWTTPFTTTTSIDGLYVFSNLKKPGSGQRYYVGFDNTAGIPGMLGFWKTDKVLPYTPENVVFPPFDLAEINLIAPSDGKW